MENKEEQDEYKECPGCGVMTEKIGGCNKIDCLNEKCKTKWCWICSRRMRSKQLLKPLKRKSPIYCDDETHHPRVWM